MPTEFYKEGPGTSWYDRDCDMRAWGKTKWSSREVDADPGAVQPNESVLAFDDADSIDLHKINMAFIQTYRLSIQHHACAAAINAVAGLAKVNGLVVDRVESKVTNPESNLATRELQLIVQQLRAGGEGVVIEQAGSGAQEP